MPCAMGFHESRVPHSAASEGTPRWPRGTLALAEATAGAGAGAGRGRGEGGMDQEGRRATAGTTPSPNLTPQQHTTPDGSNCVEGKGLKLCGGRLNKENPHHERRGARKGRSG